MANRTSGCINNHENEVDLSKISDNLCYQSIKRFNFSEVRYNSRKHL